MKAMEKSKATRSNGKKLKTEFFDAVDMAIYHERKDGEYVSQEVAMKLLKRLGKI